MKLCSVYSSFILGCLFLVSLLANAENELNVYQGVELRAINVLEQSYDNASAVVVRFNLPLAADKDFRQYLQLSSKELQQPSQNWVLSEDGLLAIYPFVEPQTQYQVTVLPGIEAVNGIRNKLKTSNTLTTRNLTAAANLASSGHILTPKLRKALPVITVDIGAVDLDVFKVPEQDYFHVLNAIQSGQQQNYYQLNSLTELGATLIHSARYDIPHRKHQRTTTNLDLSDIAALEENGIYLAVLRTAGKYDYYYDANYFVVSDIGLQVRKFSNHMDVYTHSISSGEPLSDVSLQLYKAKDHQPELLAQLETDQFGHGQFENYYTQGSLIIARINGEMTPLQYSYQALNLEANQNALSPHRDLQVYAYGPRDLYRPGETVVINILLRDFDGKLVSPVPLDVLLTDAKGNQVVAEVLNQSHSGLYQFEFHLPEGAAAGNWSLRAKNSQQFGLDYSFKVEDFMPERMKLNLFDGDPLKRRIVHNQLELKVPVEGVYLYGAPGAGNKVDGFVLAELDRQPFEQWQGYYFGNGKVDINYPRKTLSEIELDANGKGHFVLNLDEWADILSPLSLTTSASLYESGGRPVTRTISVTNILADKLVGIAPEFSDRAESNSKPQFKFIATNAQGDLLAAEGYRISLINEDRNYYWEYDESRGWRWHYDSNEYETYSVELNFDGKVASSLSLPVKWGQYRIEVFDQNNQLMSAYRFSTRWSWWSNNSSDANLKPEHIHMAFQDNHYAPGAVAKLNLVPPLAGKALITLESNDEVLWVGEKELSAEGTVLDIPLQAQWSRHDIYATALMITPGDMQHAVSPKRAMGFVHLPLRRHDAEYNLSIDVPARTEPQRTLQAKVKLENAPLLTDQVWVTLAAVDVGVLNITRFPTPDPVGFFFGARRYQMTAHDVYGRIIDNAGFEYVQQRFGGGFSQSMAELSRGGKKPKNDVKIVSIQTQPVAFDSNGEALIDVALPEFNGKLRWMAVAWSEQRFGSAEAETTVADRIVTQLSTPRFMAYGDQAVLSLDVTNLSGEEQEIELNMTTSGALQGGEAHRFTLADKQKQTLQYQVSVKGKGEGSLSMNLSGIGQNSLPINMSRQWQIGTRSAYPTVTRKQRAILDLDEAWLPELNVDDLLVGSIQAQLILSSTPPIDINSHFSYMLTYPYGCTEQTTSSGYPWVLLSTAKAQHFGLMDTIEQRFKQTYDDALRKQQIEAAIERLKPRFKSSGGFGLWSNHSEEVSWLSVYVADFLSDAAAEGVAVPNEMLQKNLQRLGFYLRGNYINQDPWHYSSAYYNFATRAYAGYVLSKQRKASLADLRKLFEKAQQDSDYRQSGLAWMHLGAALKMAGDNKRAQQAFERGLILRRGHGEYFGDYGSKIRDLALSYAIAADYGVATDELLLELFMAVKEQSWLSTQDRNALFKAAVAGIEQGDSPSILALINTKDFSQKLNQSEDFKTMLNGEQLASVTGIVSHSQRLYASMELVGEFKQAPLETSNGLHISRRFWDLDGKEKDMTQLQSGELVLVQLLVSADKRTPDALVVDLLPAGLELENQNLANASVSMDSLLIEGESMEHWQRYNNLQYQAYLDDRFVAALRLDTHRTSSLFYLARAVTPGSYQVPNSYVEDMYQPEVNARGATIDSMTIHP